MKKSKITKFIEKKLKDLCPQKTQNKYSNEYFIKAKGMGDEVCRLNFLNLTMPEVKSFLREFSLQQELGFADCEKLWFESDIFEVKTIALYWLDQQNLELLLKNHKKILAWAHEIDNWAHADQLCSIYARLFEAAEKLILPTYLKWNRHKNPWLRRCSMVGTFYYSRQRKKQPQIQLVQSLVFPHLAASEYYVQKAVGWTIREMYNVYPIETLKFINRNLPKLSSTAWVAASEKLDKKTKTVLLKRRKFNRLKQKK